MQNIGDWLNAKFGAVLLEGSCKLCDLSGTGEQPTPVVPTPVMGYPDYYNIANYTLPTGCSYDAIDAEKICCEDNEQRKVCYTFSEVNSFWANDVTTTCDNIQSVKTKCSEDSEASDQCLRMNLYNKYQLSSSTNLYGW